MTHTPGPWRLFSPSLTDKGYLPLVGAEKDTGWCTAIGKIREDLPADANLIVVAPEMFEALETLVRCLDSNHVMRSSLELEQAKEIIKKARGTDHDDDPTPYCTWCGALSRKNCKCPPRAEND